ncbi:MAG: TetR/AcrR family transcriptional regulator [Bacteroidetes bacterium]|nr:MAG: TetR/AcrR family transcriptional regulator [Bacteroidota bacterium]
MPKTRIAELRKREILTHLHELIVQEGLEGASMTKVAKRMEVNSSLLFHYFPTKDAALSALINQLLEHYERHFVPMLEGQPDAGARFSKVLEALFSPEWDALTEGRVFYSCYPLIFREAEIKRRFQQLFAQFHAHLVQELERARQHGLIKVEDPALAAHLIISMVEGINFYENILSAPELVEAQYAAFRRLVMQALRAGVV